MQPPGLCDETIFEIRAGSFSKVRVVSGGKIQKERLKKRFHHAGQAFRMAASTVRNTHTPLGEVFRKNLARGGPSKAILAVADKMANSIYYMISTRTPYKEDVLQQNQLNDQVKKIRRLEKQVQKMRALLPEGRVI